MGSVRLHKVNELFKREISQIIQRDLANPRVGFTTVTHVDISADLKHAAVRVSVMGDDAQRKITLVELNKAAGFIQHQIARHVTIRTMPRLQFKLDRSLDAVYRVEELLGEIHAHDETPGGAAHAGEDAPADDPDEPER
jgi:ribosome-binding factor A